MPLMNPRLFSSPVLSSSHRRLLRLSCFSSTSATAAAPPPLPPSPLSSPKNPFLYNYLVTTLGFSQTLALSSLKRLPRIQSADRPDAAVRLLRQHGLSEAHLRKLVAGSPQLLFADADRILRPKLRLLHDLGLSGPALGLFLSKNPSLLTYSLARRLSPSVAVLRRFLSASDVVLALHRCKWLICKDPDSRLLPNLAFLRDDCKIDGPQLRMLLTRQPRVVAAEESALRDRVRRIAGMGFPVGDRMFVYALYSFTCVAPATVKRKLELFRRRGFDEEEVAAMIRRAPSVIRTSEQKLRSGIEFFLDEVGVGRSELVRRPLCLMYSMERRVAPRHRVLRVLRSKGMMPEKEAADHLLKVLQSTEEEFLKKYVLRFGDEAGELLGAYSSDCFSPPPPPATETTHAGGAV